MVYVVTGLPRSGTSLMMKMLHKGGLIPFADNHLSYESDFTISLPHDYEFLENCKGRVIKVLDPHIFQLPYKHKYTFIWMKRNPKEQAKSQIKFLKATAPILPFDKGSSKRMAQSIREDTFKCFEMFKDYDCDLIKIRFETLLKKPLTISQSLSEFIKILEPEAMAACVKQRSAKCLPYFMEVEQL